MAPWHGKVCGRTLYPFSFWKDQPAQAWDISEIFVLVQHGIKKGMYVLLWLEGYHSFCRSMKIGQPLNGESHHSMRLQRGFPRA